MHIFSASGRRSAQFVSHLNVRNASFFKRFTLHHKTQALIKPLGAALGVQTHLRITPTSGHLHQRQQHIPPQTVAAQHPVYCMRPILALPATAGNKRPVATGSLSRL